MKTISGERIFLRKIEKSDITDDIMTWFNDKELMKFYTNSKKTISKENLLESIENGEKRGDLYTFGIFETTGGTLIGTIKLGPINFAHRTADLVTLIGNRNFLGKGLAVDAIRLGNKLAFEEFDLRKLYGGMYESNIPSIKSYMRADWLIEGRLKGFYIVDNRNEDRILVGCFNPEYFSQDEVDEVKERQSFFYNF